MGQTMASATGCAYPSDATLWAAFKSGDKIAFAAIYHRYYAILVHNSLRIAGDKDIIRDCIHDLFVEIWKNKTNLSFPKSVKAYLISAIQRKLFRQLKRARVRTSLKEVDELTTPETENTAEKRIIAGETRIALQNTIHKALDTLTRRQKEAVYLRFYANLSYAEIAGRMAISTDSIYNLVSKAMDNMQGELNRTLCQNRSELRT